MSDLSLLMRLLALLTIANSVPMFAKNIFGERFSAPLDGGRNLADGRPIFGDGKTIRGLLLSGIFTTVSGWLLGLGWEIGLMISSMAMLGDLMASFTKRRLGLPPHSQAFGLDQIPESLLPLLAVCETFGLSFFDIAVIVAVFTAGEIVLSRLLFRIGLRDRPH